MKRLLLVLLLWSIALPCWAGASRSFSGAASSTNKIDWGDQSYYRMTSAVSICGWYKATSQSLFGLLVGKPNGATHVAPYYDYGLGQRGDASNGFFSREDTGGEADCNSGANCNMNGSDVRNWNWMCMAWDKTVNSGLPNLYGNATLVTSYDVRTGNTAGITDGGQTLRDGIAVDNSSDALKGQLAYIHVYSRQLAQWEVQTLMFQPGIIKDNLVGYFPLLDPSTTVETDQSTNQNSGTVGSAATTNADGPPIMLSGYTS